MKLYAEIFRKTGTIRYSTSGMRRTLAYACLKIRQIQYHIIVYHDICLKIITTKKQRHVISRENKSSIMLVHTFSNVFRFGNASSVSSPELPGQVWYLYLPRSGSCQSCGQIYPRFFIDASCKFSYSPWPFRATCEAFLSGTL